jgi:small nuclear ribonucleoprotein (snRNP)-like protein
MKIMSKITLRLILSGTVMALLLTIVSFALPNESMAKKKTVAIAGMSYNVNSSLADNIKSLVGKKVSVITISGKTFTGFVKEVGPHLIHLEKLENKEFFDALIRTENIAAIEALFRKYEH